MSRILEEKNLRESESLRSWRTLMYKEILGDCGNELLDALLESEVDHHQLRKLIGDGCPSKLAVEILL